MKKYFFDIFIIALFMFLVGLFFYQTIFFGKLPVPSDTLIGLYHPWRDLYDGSNPRGVPFKNFLITDPIRQQIPWRKIVIDSWKQIKIPSWNSFSFSGTPLIANPQAGVFYPLNFLFLIFDFPAAWTLLIILQPLLAGLFFYFYLRHLGFHPAATLFGAISWSFAGFNIAWLTWGTIGHVVLWLPFILLAIDEIIDKKSAYWVCLLIIGLVSQFFAGHTQVSLYLMIVSLAYALWRLSRVSSTVRLIKIRWFGLVVSFSLILTAVQWFPLLQMIRESSRLLDTTIWLKEGWFLPWENLAQFIAPDFFGNPTTLNYWGKWNYGEFIGYIGLVPFMFAVFALINVRTAFAKFWKIVMLLTLIFILPTPFAKLPYQLQIPILSTLQPTRLMFIIDFSLVMLAVIGMDWWLKQKKNPFLFPVILVGLLVLSLWLIVIIGKIYSPALTANLQVSQQNLILPTIVYFLTIVVILFLKIIKNNTLTSLATVAFIVLTVFDVLRFGWKFTPFTSRDYFFPNTKVISFLQNQIKPFRIAALDDKILPPNSSGYYGVETVDGYDPLYLSRYEEFIAAINRGKADISSPFGFNRIIRINNPDSPLFSILNVRYLLTLTDLNKPYLDKVYQEGETRVYLDKRFMDRAYLVEKLEIISDKQKIIEKLYDSKFNPRTTAIVETPIPLIDLPLNKVESVKMVEYHENNLILEVQIETARYLVIGNIYLPNWRAKLDGVETTLYKTNYLFSGLVVPAGKHIISLEYAPFN